LGYRDRSIPAQRRLGCRDRGIPVDFQRPFSGPPISYEKTLSIDKLIYWQYTHLYDTGEQSHE
jgi:hypothetical protein